MKKNKRHQTNLISLIILVVTVILLVFLSVCLYKQPSLEVRFNVIINWLSKLEHAIAGLDSHIEIVICIFALYIAKCQLPIPMGALCVISGMVFPLPYAIIINIVFIAFFYTGLGCALALSGVMFLRNYFASRASKIRESKKPIPLSSQLANDFEDEMSSVQIGESR